MTLNAVEKWVNILQSCRSAPQVIATVRDYLSTWTPSEIGEIPEEAWPGDLSTSAEVSVAAVAAKFVELRYTDDSPARVSLQELGEVMSAASTRLGQIGSVLVPTSDP